MQNPIKEQQKYLDIIQNVDEQYRLMKKTRPLSKSELAYFYNEFVINATYDSNAIEGNALSYEEVKVLLEKDMVVGNHLFRDYQEVVGYKRGIDFLYNSLKENRDISEEFIKAIHKFVLFCDDRAGEYRTVQNYVGSNTQIKYIPPYSSEVAAMIKAYIEKIQSELNEIRCDMRKDEIPWDGIFKKLAKHHIEFENIHPFIDGNGRTGRLILTYEMISVGLLPLDIDYNDRERYFSAFQPQREEQNDVVIKMAGIIAESELKMLKIWNFIYMN